MVSSLWINPQLLHPHPGGVSQQMAQVAARSLAGPSGRAFGRPRRPIPSRTMAGVAPVARIDTPLGPASFDGAPRLSRRGRMAAGRRNDGLAPHFLGAETRSARSAECGSRTVPNCAVLSQFMGFVALQQLNRMLRGVRPFMVRVRFPRRIRFPTLGPRQFAIALAGL